MGQLKPQVCSSSIKGHPLAEGLVGQWLFNEGSGTQANDSSGYKNHGTLTNMDPDTDWVPGPNGYALEFDGSDDYVTVNTTTFSSSDPWTAIVKAKKTAIDSDVSGILLGEKAVTTNFIRLYNGNLQFRNSAGTIYPFANTYDSDFHTYALVADGSGNATLYKDGVYSSDQAAVTSFVIDAIGHGYLTDSWGLEGQISHVSIYNRALSAAEISSLYHDPFQMHDSGDAFDTTSSFGSKLFTVLGKALKWIMNHHHHIRGN